MKKNRAVIAALIVFAFIAALIMPTAPEAVQSSTGVSYPVILIDPGHGGVDGGAVGADGTPEKEINLAIALKLRDTLASAGFTVLMTREDDRSIHDSTAKTIREQKISDLHNRLAMTTLFEDSILISIHQNTIDSPSVSGAQVFYSPNNEESAVLAECLQDNFNLFVNKKQKTTKAAGKNLYLFYNAENAAVLAECGFMSNPAELSQLKTDEYQEKIVFVIYKSLLEYLGRQK